MNVTLHDENHGFTHPPPPPPPLILGGPGTDKILDFRGGFNFRFFQGGGGPNFPRGGGGGAIKFSSAYIL